MSAPDSPLLVLAGAPGAGKSSWARRNFAPRQIVSSDELRSRIGDDGNDQRATPHAVEAMHVIVAGRMELNQLTVVDATNRTAEQREKLRVHAIRWCRPQFLVVFTAPLQVCLERNARRRGTRRVPDKWLTETHEMITAAFDPATAYMPEGFSGVLFVPHEGHGYAGGILDMRRWVDSPWLDVARQTPPPGLEPRDGGRWPLLHRSGWTL